jgi:transcriptional regulator with XRE-family HTH domain
MPRIPLQRIGPLVRERREDRGIREVAKEIGISPATLSRIEHGKVPDLETFRKVCRWLKIDPADVLGRPKSIPVKTEGEITAPAVHFKADRAVSRQAAQALAEMILAAQKMMPSRK